MTVINLRWMGALRSGMAHFVAVDVARRNNLQQTAGCARRVSGKVPTQARMVVTPPTTAYSESMCCEAKRTSAANRDGNYHTPRPAANAFVYPKTGGRNVGQSDFSACSLRHKLVLMFFRQGCGSLLFHYSC